MTERNLIGEAVFDFSFNSLGIAHAQEAELASFVRDRLLEIADEVFSEVSGPETVHIEQLEIELGDFDHHNFKEEMSGRFREKLRVILQEKINTLPVAPASWEGRFSKDRIGFGQLQRFLQDGFIPGGADFPPMNEILAQAMRRNKEALLDFLKRTSNQDIVVQRLSRQFAPDLLEELLKILAPAQAEQLSEQLNEALRCNDTEAGAGMIAGLLHRLLQANAAGQDAHQPVASTLAMGNAENRAPVQAADTTGQNGMLKARLEAALLEGTPQSIADIWDALLLHHADLVQTVFTQQLGNAAAQEKLSNRFPEPMLQDLLSLLAPSGRPFIDALLHQPEFHATQDSGRLNMAAWQHTLSFLHDNAGRRFNRGEYANWLLLRLAGQGRDTGSMLLALSRIDAGLAKDMDVRIQAALRRKHVLHQQLRACLEGSTPAELDEIVTEIQQFYPDILVQLLQQIRNLEKPLSLDHLGEHECRQLAHALRAAELHGNSKPNSRDGELSPALGTHSEMDSRSLLADLMRSRTIPSEPVASHSQDDMPAEQADHPPTLSRPAEQAEAQPDTPLTPSGLMRARLLAAMTTGQASDLADIWPVLLERYPGLVREAFLACMSEIRAREKMLLGWPASMLNELLRLLAPQQASVILRLLTLPGLADEAERDSIAPLLWRHTIAYLHIALSTQWRWENYATGLLCALTAQGAKPRTLRHIQELVTLALESSEADSARAQHHALLLQQVQFRLEGIDREHERLDALDELVRVNPHAVVQLYRQLQRGEGKADLVALTPDEIRSHIEAWLALMPGKSNGKLKQEINLHASHAHDSLLFYRQILDTLLHQQDEDSEAILAQAGIARPVAASTSAHAERLAIAGLDGAGTPARAIELSLKLLEHLAAPRQAGNAALVAILSELVRDFPADWAKLQQALQAGTIPVDTAALTTEEAAQLVKAMTTMHGQSSELQLAIAQHASKARDPGYFYHNILDSLLRRQTIDLESAAGLLAPAGTLPGDRSSVLLQQLRQRLAGATQVDATDALAELERDYPDSLQLLSQQILSGNLQVLPGSLNEQECQCLLQAVFNRQTGNHGFEHIVEPYALHAPVPIQLYRDLLSRILKHEPIHPDAVTTAIATMPQAIYAEPVSNPDTTANETGFADANESVRLRSRLHVALTSGQADGISDLWPELAGRHAALLREEFLRLMGMPDMRKRVAQGWPETARLALVSILLPQQYPVIARLVREPEFSIPVSALFWQHMLACLHTALKTRWEWETCISGLPGVLEENGIAPESIRQAQEKMLAYASAASEIPPSSPTVRFSAQRSAELQQQLFERLTGKRRDKDCLSPLIELVQHDGSAVSQLYRRLQDNKSLLDLAGLSLSEARMHIQVWFTQLSPQTAADMVHEIEKHAIAAQNSLEYYLHVLDKLLRGEVVDIEQAIASARRAGTRPGILPDLPGVPVQPSARHELLLRHLLARLSGNNHEDASSVIAELRQEHSAALPMLLRKIQAGSVVAKPEHLNSHECQLLVEALVSPQETFRQAVAHYAARAAAPERYYRQLLSYLLRNEPVDLETAAQEPAGTMQALPGSTSLTPSAPSGARLPQITDTYESSGKMQQSQMDSGIETPVSSVAAATAATGHEAGAAPSHAEALSRMLIERLAAPRQAGHASLVAILSELVRDFPADWAKLQQALHAGTIPVDAAALTADEAAQLVKAMTTTYGQSSELQLAIAQHASKARDPGYFYRGILDSLLHRKTIDLESAAGLLPPGANALAPAGTLPGDRSSVLLQQLRQRLAGATQVDATEALAELERDYPDALQLLSQQILSGKTRLQSQAQGMRESQYLVQALARRQSNGRDAEFLHAIELHAARAASPLEYYRRVLDDLALGRPVDLEAASNLLPQEKSQAPAPALPAQPDAERAFVLRGLETETIKEEDLLPQEGEEIYISNAGMVLMAPYLPQLFKQMALLEEGRFKNRPAQERGIHLLQFAINESCDSPEFLLPLNKILCGLALAQPIVREIQPHPAETETIEGLLVAMIRNWTIIGSTSIQGLRESFLQRAGRLQVKDGNWHLAVEPRGIDVLLDQLPWSFSIIRHPWMKQAVYVGWR